VQATLKDLGELATIERIVRRLPAGRGVVVGPGDDCAVVRARNAAPHDWLLTSDPVIEGIHFTRDTPAARIGWKAVGRVLSDIAAMGGEPRWALLNIVAPPDTAVARLDGLCRGAARLADACGLALAGGDTAAGPTLAVHAFAVGDVPRGTAVLRSGAKPGDLIAVTGALGGSILGKHLRFTPRLAEGRWLRAWASAMIDVSDGLASDVRHLADMSRAGARLFLDRIPVARAAGRMRDGRSPVIHALRDGEDFELLFTVPARRGAALLRAWRRRFRLPCAFIGVMTAHAGRVECAGEDGRVQPLDEAGYEHFRA
jgi:thiamine-monophosphate kinase